MKYQLWLLNFSALKIWVICFWSSNSRAVSVAEFWCALPRKKVNLLCFFTKAHSGKSNVWHPKKLNSASGFWLFGECQIIEVGFSGHTVHWAGWHSSSSCSILNLMHVVTQANGFVEWLRFFPHFFSTSPSDSCWFNLKLNSCYCGFCGEYV